MGALCSFITIPTLFFRSIKAEKQALLDELDQREGTIAELERKVAKLTTTADVKREREERVRTRCLLVKNCIYTKVAVKVLSSSGWSASLRPAAGESSSTLQILLCVFSWVLHVRHTIRRSTGRTVTHRPYTHFFWYERWNYIGQIFCGGIHEK